MCEHIYCTISFSSTCHALNWVKTTVSVQNRSVMCAILVAYTEVPWTKTWKSSDHRSIWFVEKIQTGS